MTLTFLDLLDKLKELDYVPEALIDAQDREGCMEGTRVKLLDELLAWSHEPDGSRIFWLNGMAGTGKTTIAYTVAEQCSTYGVLGASFFCSRSIADCNDPSNIFPAIAYQLGRFYKPYRERLAEGGTRDGHEKGRGLGK